METYGLHFRDRFYSNCCRVENLFNKVAQILMKVRLKKAQLQIPIHVNSTGIAFSSLQCFLGVCKLSLAAWPHTLPTRRATTRLCFGLQALTTDGGYYHLK